MIKVQREWAARIGFGLWGVAAFATVMAVVSGGGDVTWRVLQVPLVIGAASATCLAVLGRVIAPTRESYQLGYDAGLRDGARAVLATQPARVVVDITSKPGRRRTDLPTG